MSDRGRTQLKIKSVLTEVFHQKQYEIILIITLKKLCKLVFQEFSKRKKILWRHRIKKFFLIDLSISLSKWRWHVSKVIFHFYRISDYQYQLYWYFFDFHLKPPKIDRIGNLGHCIGSNVLLNDHDKFIQLD